MKENLIKHDIRRPEWTDARIRKMSAQKGIMRATEFVVTITAFILLVKHCLNIIGIENDTPMSLFIAGLTLLILYMVRPKYPEG